MKQNGSHKDAYPINTDHRPKSYSFPDKNKEANCSHVMSYIQNITYCNDANQIVIDNRPKLNSFPDKILDIFSILVLHI